MATLSEKLQLTLNSKNAIKKVAQEDLGVDITDTTLFSDYAEKLKDAKGSSHFCMTFSLGSNGVASGITSVVSDILNESSQCMSIDTTDTKLKFVFSPVPAMPSTADYTITYINTEGTEASVSGNSQEQDITEQVVYIEDINFSHFQFYIRSTYDQCVVTSE